MMDFENLKKSVQSIKMSDEMQTRIIKNCRSTARQETEDIPMKKRNHAWLIKPAVIAAVLSLCVAAVGAENYVAHFRDVTDWTGAVTGTEYVQATNDIQMDLTANKDALTLHVTFLTPDTTPYKYLETLGIDSYQVVDASGSVVFSGEDSAFFELLDGTASISLPVSDMDSGTYTLQVDAFSGASKADAPIRISGFWKCDFTI